MNHRTAITGLPGWPSERSRHGLSGDPPDRNHTKDYSTLCLVVNLEIPVSVGHSRKDAAEEQFGPPPSDSIAISAARIPYLHITY